MKRLLCLILCLTAVIGCAAPALAISYNDTSLPRYIVTSVVADNQLYLYPKADSSYQPLCAYKKGTILRVSQWYVYDSSHYCYAVGPDGKEGYIRKECLNRYYDYSDDYPVFTVTSTFYESGSYRLYMYAEPSSNYDPVGVSGYVNGIKLKVIDYYCHDKYAYAVGPDNHVGFVPKSWITYESGTIRPQSESLPVSEYGGGYHGTGSGSGSGGGTVTPAPTTKPVYNTGYTATASSYYYYGNTANLPACAVDGNDTTSWDAYGEHAGAWFRLTSNDGQKELNGLRIINGHSMKDKNGSSVYYKNSRIQNYSIYVDGRYVMSGTLADHNNWQNIVFPYTVYGSNLTMYIDTVYQGSGNSATYGVCITEILPV